MNDLLIVIHGLNCGGAEKSLISLLNALPRDEWKIDLLIANPRGIFYEDIPEHINVLKEEYEFENYGTPLCERRRKVAGIKDLLCQIVWQIKKRGSSRNGLNLYEYKWQIWGRKLSNLKKHYDLAISYMNGFPNYYVIEKVSSTKKILWVHNEFEQLGYEYSFEKNFYKSADAIVTISDSCKESICNVWPEMRDKVHVLENISSESSIKVLAQKKIEDPFFEFEGLKIISVGRLSEQKNFDLAIDAAAKISSNVDFLWYILGDGSLRDHLQKKIEDLGLCDKVILAGVKANPYPYIDKADIFVQSSKYEGKSIVLDEAKILHKPIVVTNYPTVINSIQNETNGLVVEMSADNIADAISRLWSDIELKKQLTLRLANSKNGNEEEIDKYIMLFSSFIKEKQEC